MDCPYCEEELNCTDYYGRGNPNSFDFVKTGDIYKCENEECEMYNESQHTRDDSGELHDGFPC